MNINIFIGFPGRFEKSTINEQVNVSWVFFIQK